jgi:AcrR family transcriptional regulator
MGRSSSLDQSDDDAPDQRAERLTREQIIAAALQLTRANGMASLTMRALADELGVTPMATYYYVHNKHELIDLVTDAVMATIPIPDPATGTWDERLWQLNRASRAAMARHPGLADRLMHTPLPPAAQRLDDASLGLLREAGFAEDDARLAYATFRACMFGRLVTDGRPTRDKEAAFYRFAFDTLIAGFKSRLGTATR